RDAPGCDDDRRWWGDRDAIGRRGGVRGDSAEGTRANVGDRPSGHRQRRAVGVESRARAALADGGGGMSDTVVSLSVRAARIEEAAAVAGAVRELLLELGGTPAALSALEQ